jgi:hypothetical protein
MIMEELSSFVRYREGWRLFFRGLFSTGKPLLNNF